LVNVPDVRPRHELRAAIPPLLKHLNERTVFETIRRSAPISRAEISRQAGISKPTVSLALQSLLEAGLVREAEAEVDRPRYGAVFFEPVPDAALVLGLDVGARFIRGAICDLRGTVLARQDLELPDVEVGAALETVAKLRASLIDATALSAERIDNAVVGVPAVVGAADEKLRLTTIRNLEGRDFRADLVDRLELPVRLDNDINLAARGEQWQGVARGVDDFVFLSIGTGLGAGLVLNGELHRGRNGAAGEVDLISAGRDDDVDPCASALSSLAARLAARHRGETMLAAPYDARSIFAAARSGDALAVEVVSEEARRIALHVAPIVAVTDVALVVIGGGIGSNADLLLDPIRSLLAEWLPFQPRVEVSGLGDAAVLTGALAVGLDVAQESVFANRGEARGEAVV
jgi:predicted NBD/HSP70 family sugar kinase